jgi:cell division septation protein DedD
MSINGAVGEMENELLAELDQGFEQPEEQVYISKITPLDAQRNQALANAAEQAAKSVDSAADSTEADSDPVTSSSGQNLSTKTEDQAINTSESTEAKDKPKASADNNVPIESDPKTTTKSVEVAAADLEQQQREQELRAALVAESRGRQPAVEVGWIVQVGLYLEEKGAKSKMSDLGRLGFQPASTIVDTNRGPKTGTRVWLGPFAKRSQAESENKALKKKTGKDGFIRVYP